MITCPKRKAIFQIYLRSSKMKCNGVEPSGVVVNIFTSWNMIWIWEETSTLRYFANYSNWLKLLHLPSLHSHLQARCKGGCLSMPCLASILYFWNGLLTSAVVPHWDQSRHHHSSTHPVRIRLNCFLLPRWARRLMPFPNYLCMCLDNMQTDTVLKCLLEMHKYFKSRCPCVSHLLKRRIPPPPQFW